MSSLGNHAATIAPPMVLAAVVRSSRGRRETIDRLSRAAHVSAEDLQSQLIPSSAPAIAGVLTLHPSSSVMAMAVRLLADRAAATGLPLLVRFDPPSGLEAPTRFPALPLHELAGLDCVAVAVTVRTATAVVYPSDDFVIAVNSSPGDARADRSVIVALQCVADGAHCEGDRRIGALSPGAEVAQLEAALVGHAEAVLLAWLGARGGAVATATPAGAGATVATVAGRLPGTPT